MAINSSYRASIIRSLLPQSSERLVDVGCGPLTSAYPYTDRAAQITCVDWKIRTFGAIPDNINYIDGDFTELDLPSNTYDTVIAADVFEHILIERENVFAQKCVSVLKDNGQLLVSVPHQGTFTFLDPYLIKPAIHRLLWHLGLYNSTHNGSCDIRKGHKHYTVRELEEKFKPLRLEQVVYYGYLFDPLLTWAVALSRGLGKFPGYAWLERACSREFDRDYGDRSFNVALRFRKPAI